MKLLNTTIDETIIERLRTAVRAKEKIQGYTHNFYRYPARFSPRFVREVIQIFSKPGDVILDPFVGGGTTLVEALANQRHSIGFDVSPISSFVSTAKTTLISDSDVNEIFEWSKSVLTKRITEYKSTKTYYDDAGYLDNLPWRIKLSIELILDEVDKLKTDEQKNFAKCLVLRTAQWAVDCKENIPSTKDFRRAFSENLKIFAKGMKSLNDVVQKNSKDVALTTCFCVNQSSESLSNCEGISLLPSKPKLVITSPPYVGVHMLYHQWQVNGRKRTRTPFWIIDSLDGMGSSHYTFGYYRDHGKRTYFENAERVFRSIYESIADDAIIVQLVGFSHYKRYLPKYLEMMENSGYEELPLITDKLNRTKRIWRDVSNRKWYMRTKNEVSPSKEVLLLHRKR
jgi:DNA modification methylase